MGIRAGILTFILLTWMGGSSYWYVCKIKKDCKKRIPPKYTTYNPDENNDRETLVHPEEKNTEVEKKKELTKEEKINDIKSKISDGYTVKNFKKNSKTNNNIESAFDEFADNLKLFTDKNKDAKIELIGYTDNSGSEKTNLFYGKKRALFMKSKLVQKGIPSNTFIVKSMGEANPIATNETEQGRLENRRVVIKLIDKN